MVLQENAFRCLQKAIFCFITAGRGMSCFDLAAPPLALPASHAPSSFLALEMASCIIVSAPECAHAQSQREGEAGFSEVCQLLSGTLSEVPGGVTH